MALQERFYGVEVPGLGGHMESGLSVLVLGSQVGTLVQKELDDGSPAEIAGPHEGGLNLLFCESPLEV